MPHTSGTHTVGLASSDFLTLNDAFGDYSGGAGGLTGNLKYIVEGNTTLDTTLVTRAIYFQRMNGFTFTITASRYHYGVWGDGIRITLNGNSDMQIQIGILSASGHVIIEKLEFDGGRRIDVRGMNPFAQFSIGRHTVRNCLLNNTDVLMQHRNRSGSDNCFYNNKIFNNSNLNITENTGATIQPTTIENNTFYFLPGAGPALLITAVNPLTTDSQTILRNNVFFCNAANDVSVTANIRTKPFAYNNAFSSNGGTAVAWRTGSSGNIDYITAAEFESVDLANQDFLKPVKIDAIVHISGKPRKGPVLLKTKFSNYIEYTPAGILTNSGIIPTLTTKDIANETYGEFEQMYPIGCYNAQPKNLDDVWEV